MPGIQTLLDKLLDKTDLMVIEIVEDATKVCFARKDDINLHKLGIKLMLPKYNGSDTLEMFLHFIKEATKRLSLAKILRGHGIANQPLRANAERQGPNLV